jgi:hypothetical protein
MTIFMIDPSAIVFGYVIAILATVMMYFLFRSSSPREQIVYIGKYPPKLHALMRLACLATVPSSAVLAFFCLFCHGTSCGVYSVWFGRDGSGRVWVYDGAVCGAD